MKSKRRVNLLIFSCLLIGLLIPLAIAYYSFTTVKRIDVITHKLNSNNKLEIELHDLLLQIMVLENSVRDYCMSDSTIYLQTYKAEIKVTQNKLNSFCDSLANSNKSLSDNLKNVVNTKLIYVSHIEHPFDNYGINSSQKDINSVSDQKLTALIKFLTKKIEKNINTNTTKLADELNYLKQTDELYDYAGTASAILVFILVLFVVFKNSRNRDNFEKELLIFQEKLIESEKRFMVMFYNNPANNIISDFETKEIIDVNQSYLNLVGYEKEELIADSSLHNHLKVDSNKITFIYNELKSHKFINDVEVEIITKQNNVKTVLLSGLLINGLNKRMYSLYYLQDITDTKKHTEEINKAKSEAENSATVKEQFLANMSHEIRTPLNAIIGFSGLLTKTDLNEKQQNYLKAIKTSSSNLLNIANDILDYSKMEAGMFKIEKINFDLKVLVKSVFAMFLDVAETNKIIYTYHIDDAIPLYLSGDPTRLTQILVNIIGNAFKFTNTGSISLTIKQKHICSSISTIEFAIKDTGIGIDEENIEKIFERFNQAEKNSTRQYGGTGLGLAIVKRLIELQQGLFTIESEIKKGTSFLFTLTYPVLNNITDFTLANTDNTLHLSVKNKKVLVVEDNNLNQLLTKELLLSYNLQVTLVNNGQAAIQLLSNQSFDLILMDLQMPILDGYKTTEHIRTQMNLQIPIIAMSAHALASEKEKCFRFGMNDFISKPFKEEEFKAMLSTYLVSISNDASKSKLTINTNDNRYKVIDLSAIIKMSKGRNTFVQNMIELYITDMPIEMNKLQEAIFNTDYSLIQSVSHKIKSSIGIIGMCKDGYNIMEEVEDKSITAESIIEIKNLFKRFNDFFLLSIAELEYIIEQKTYSKE